MNDREKGYEQLKRHMTNEYYKPVERAIQAIDTDSIYRRVPMKGHPTAPEPYPQPQHPGQ